MAVHLSLLFKRVFGLQRPTAALFLLLLLLTSCEKAEQIELPWTELSSPTVHNLHGIHFVDAQTGFAAGGDTWYLGIQLHTTDGGASWQVDSLTDKALFGLHFTERDRGYSVGIENYFLHRDAQASDWAVKRVPGGSIYRDVAFFDQSGGIVVGGQAYQYGQLIRVDADFRAVQIDSFEHELSGVAFADAQTAVAVGYGIVLHSVDAGRTWQRLQLYGDFFRDVHFPSPQSGYIVGSSGSILRTSDGGQSWQNLRDGDRLTVSDVPFRAVFFVDERKGYVVGEDGHFWRTLDGGDSWQRIKGFPNTDLYAVHVVDGIGYIVGANGRMFRFED
ncbi:MAG: YCF48-related protein [Bacteroidota bacterium]